MNQFKIIGYYISEVIDMPRYLKKLGERMLSVSSCLGEMHPKLECCFVNAWSDEEKRAYRIRLKLSEGQYADYVKTVQDLFACRHLDSDCRFRSLWDAVDFYEKFCGAVPCCLVSVSTTSEYYEILEVSIPFSVIPCRRNCRRLCLTGWGFLAMRLMMRLVLHEGYRGKGSRWSGFLAGWGWCGIYRGMLRIRHRRLTMGMPMRWRTRPEQCKSSVPEGLLTGTLLEDCGSPPGMRRVTI